MTQIAEALESMIISMSEISVDPKNTRFHPESNIKSLKTSLEVYGQRKPIVVNKHTGFIEAGNGLFLAAKALGWKEIAAIYVDDDKEKAAAYGIMDNQSALLSDWNLPAPREILEELNSKDFDMSLTGFSEDEYEELFPTEFNIHNMSSELSKGYVEGIKKLTRLN